MTMPKELSALIKEGNFNPSQVEVVKDGQNVMRPDVMNFLMLASIASQAVRIRKYFDDRTPHGGVQNYVLHVDENRQEINVTYPAQSMTFINDGPDEVGVWINSPTNVPHSIGAGETYHVHFQLHKLNAFFVQCNPGLTARIRASALD